jgi:hypothetical protein
MDAGNTLHNLIVKSSPDIAASCWCGRGDSNPHVLANASPSSWPICYAHADSCVLEREDAGRTLAAVHANDDSIRTNSHTLRTVVV